MIALAALIGYLIGSIPTADWLARGVGIDLRRDGSRNPGANNARRLGGWRLAVKVLVVEMAKGAAGVSLGTVMEPTWGMLAGSLGAVAGNVVNPWFRFRGGQGLGISAGILLIAWPPGLVVALIAMGLGLRMFHTSRSASLLAAAALVVAGAIDLPLTRWGWGIPDAHILLAVGVGAVIATKQVHLLLRT